MRGQLIFLVSILLVLNLESTSAQTTLSTLATFNGINGSGASAGLIADNAGNLYGATSGGGSSNDGTIFEIAAGTNTLSTLVTFNNTNGANPYGGLFVDATGNLYGTTEFGGSNDVGTVFKVAAGNNTLSTLVTFNGSNGEYPQGGLIADAAGSLYGTAQEGGSNGYGTVFKVAAGTNTLSTLASFNYYNGAAPTAGLIADASGNLYGTTFDGGVTRYGTVFKVAAGTNTLSTLATFGSGKYSQAGLIADASGNLYGTTSGGGSNGDGTVFKVAAGTNTLSTLVTFNGANGQSPLAGLIADASGNLYGTTSGGGSNGDGTVFKIAAGTNTLSTLVTFNGANGYYPQASLIADSFGNLYGTTDQGGLSNAGTVFKLSGTGFVPVVPAMTTTQTPAAALGSVYKATSNNLEVFDPATNTFVRSGEINVSKAMVVLTHGFDDSPSRWTSILNNNESFAEALHNAEPNVNIVAWDWSTDAKAASVGSNLGYAASRTASEGAALGETLSSLLGPTYSNDVHFIGHSLGTLVDSEAISVLNAHDQSAQIQDTLLDEASIANQFISSSGTSSYPINPIPSSGAVRIDNYISSFGTLHSQVVNAVLQNDPTNPPNPTSANYWINFHSYPVSWYQSTIITPSGIGFAGAIENGSYNASDPNFQPGYWIQEDPTSPLSLSASTLTSAASVLENRDNAQLGLLQADSQSNIAKLYDGAALLKTGLSLSQLTSAVQEENNALIKLVASQNGSQYVFTAEAALTKQLVNLGAATPTVKSSSGATAAPADSSTPTSSSYMWLDPPHVQWARSSIDLSLERFGTQVS